MTDVPTQHQIKIAKQTLRYSDVGAFIMGGMTKDQARDLLRAKAKWSEDDLTRYESA